MFVDTGVEPFPLSLLEDYIAISDGHGSVELLARYGADRVLLSKKLHPGLSLALQGAASWRKEYEDQQSEIWRYAPGA